MQQNHSTPFMDWLQTLLFSSLLVGLGVVFVLTPKEAVSEGEKRKLAQFPEFSWSAMGQGAFMQQIDDFVADNFVWRYTLTDVAGHIKQGRGWAQDDIQLFSDKSTHPSGAVAPKPPSRVPEAETRAASSSPSPSALTPSAGEVPGQNARTQSSSEGAVVQAAASAPSDDAPRLCEQPHPYRQL